MAAIQRAITSLLIFTSVTSVFSGDVYGIINGSVEISAAQVTKDTNVYAITWKHNKDKAADWYEGDDAPTYYDIFKSVTTLDMQTWALNISNLQTHFSGKYSAEVNNKDPTQFVTLTVLDAVSQPNITQVCNPSSCTLTCKATEDEHSQYTWTDSRGERKDGPVWTVENRAEDQDVTYTCNISNPVSWKIETFTVPGRIAYEIILGIGSAVLVVLVLIGIGSYYCRKRKTGKLDLKTGQSSPETEERSIPMRNNDNTVEHIELSQKLLGQRNGASNRVHWHATHAENGDASHEVSINLDELSVINNGTVAELPNGTCSEATIQTDDASNSVHGHATNAENGDASHEVVINLHVGAELMPQ
ncbi:SLAM family member 8-like isoform X1 [Clupea harengus]|uniref:SLAM family member 8-like isoform X1 n=1 Tax=Clupea harengus TaxID=7950 RepID=A0A8M1KNR6_CLUHA|nr:SLAM family member 8-like isoform X1 [Clupea harengus]